MINRHVIALNRLLLAQEQLLKRKRVTSSSISNDQVNEIMDYVRKYPQKKIRHESLFTCGFSKN